MNKQNAFIVLLFVTCFSLFGTQSHTVNRAAIDEKLEPIKIIAHTDSSIFLLSKKKNEKGVWDFYVSKHNAYKQESSFVTCLNLTKIFTKGINPNSQSFEFMQGKNHIALFFTAVNQTNKILFGKIIGFDGNVSEAYVLDKEDYTNNAGIDKCEYRFYSTSKKNTLVHVERLYKSGFKRDKCILLDPFFNEIWKYDLPQLNGKTEENVIVDIDNSNRLIYYPWNFVTSANFDMNGKIIFQTIFKDPNDTVLPLKLGNLTYQMRFKKDSVKLLFVNPLKQEVISKSLYYPFLSAPIIKSITGSQVLIYGMVNIDDEDYKLMGKKAMCYRRFDIKNDVILSDTLVVLDDKIQQKLTHTYAPGSKDPTSKYFKALSENIVDGKLITVYEHGNNGQLLEVISTSYDIANNKFEWACILPRKINLYYPNLYDIVIRGYNGNLSVSFFEHRKNILKNSYNYEFGKYKLLRKPKHKHFVSYVISANNTVVKKNNEVVNDDFLFPWLSENSLNQGHFIFTKNFLPKKFLSKN